MQSLMPANGEAVEPRLMGTFCYTKINSSRPAMQPFQPHTFDPNQTSNALNNMAAGATILMLVMFLLYIAVGLYFIIMPLLIYLRLGRIAKAVESTDFTQKSLLIEIKTFVALQRKMESNSTEQTTFLQNVDKNLAMGLNEVLTAGSKAPPVSGRQ